ncbi:fructokinase [Pragia fontium DSM 5563 = ATCC 49100]|uniref:Fructokinase n=2 Tax=Pragia fontium TaxID=82985 RepID=A0AAJ4W8M1_9GAMM|nr:fructokinase [Pragia fontium DSM 5563 = ATCC 49100]
MNMTKIWSLGDAVVDLLPLENMQYQACAGGAPANVAVGVARLGVASSFVGRLGSDPCGRFMLKSLAEEGVDCQCIEQDQQYLTSTVMVDLAENGERSFTFLVSPSADQFLQQQELPSQKADILHFCSLALVGDVGRHSLNAILQQIKRQQGLVSFDLNLRAQMWQDKVQMHRMISQYCAQADILKLSDDELFWLTECTAGDWDSALTKLASYPASIKAITQGKDGCLVMYQNSIYCFDGYPVVSVDTTGAGDAYMAGLLAAIAVNGIPQQFDALNNVISQASACGALATTRKGAWSALPDINQLHSFLSIHGKLAAVMR